MKDQGLLTSDDLALERTVMAADRTLMAWTRTALSLISFGFTIYKFLQYQQAEGKVHSVGLLRGPRNMGIAMVGLGVIFLLMASVHFWREVRRLKADRRGSALRLPLALAALLSLLSVLALLNLAFQIGPF